MNDSMVPADGPGSHPPRRTTCEQRLQLARSIINHRLPAESHLALVLLMALDGWTVEEIAEWEVAA